MPIVLTHVDGESPGAYSPKLTSLSPGSTTLAETELFLQQFLMN